MDFSDIKSYIKENHCEVSLMIDSHRLEISNSPLIKILHGQHLVAFWKERPNKSINYIVYFEEKIKDELNLANIKDNLPKITEALKTFNSIRVDENFNILDQEYILINEDKLIELSNQTKIVFFFGNEGIEMAVRGKIIDKVNFFYNEEHRLAFAKKFKITQLEDCLLEYERYIKEPGNNQGFFVSEKIIKDIKPVNPPRNILHNKPEKILRDNLLSFLNRNTQHTFSKETELNNQRELDLYAEVEGRKYLIEVKWLGQSINDSGTDLTQKITDYAAREGVTQTLEYIKELIENMSYNLHCGFLCVFDVREVKKSIDYRNFDFVTDDLKVYYSNHFKKLKEISLDKL